MLNLKRASKSRPSGQWSDDDYDVFDGDQHIVGRTFVQLRDVLGYDHATLYGESDSVH